MRFIGCKENLLPFIESFVRQKTAKEGVFCDLFAGTGSVGRHFKRMGYQVIASDVLYFSYVLQRAYLTLNEYPSFAGLVARLKLKPAAEGLLGGAAGAGAGAVIAYLNEAPGRGGFVYRNYSYEGTAGGRWRRMYFTGENAMKIDAIREIIEEWRRQEWIDGGEYDFLLCALVEAVPFVSNISGTYSAFLKTWDKRAMNPLRLRLPAIFSSRRRHVAHHADGVGLVGGLGALDVLYLDPPYNERQYAPNYHVLETIARGDQPDVRGKTGMREYGGQKSVFCNGKTALQALARIVEEANFKHLLLSYSSEGIMAARDIVDVLGRYGRVEVVARPYARYKSHRLGAAHNGVMEKLYYLKPVHAKNALNDLSGAEWLYFLNSVEVTHYPAGADAGLGIGGGGRWVSGVVFLGG